MEEPGVPIKHPTRKFVLVFESQMQENMNQRDMWECDEDDLFYAELRRQVLILTAEDEEECQENRHPDAAKSLQRRFNTSPASILQQPGCYYNWSGSNETESIPTWLFNLWKSGNGTGVFIPQIIKSRRRYGPRKKNNERGRMYKPVANVN